jgi:hypothetical protein
MRAKIAAVSGLTLIMGATLVLAAGPANAAVTATHTAIPSSRSSDPVPSPWLLKDPVPVPWVLLTNPEPSPW